MGDPDAVRARLKDLRRAIDELDKVLEQRRRFVAELGDGSGIMSDENRKQHRSLREAEETAWQRIWAANRKLMDLRPKRF